MNTDDSPKKIRVALDGVKQRDIDAVIKRLTTMKKRLREDILFIGHHLAKMRDTIPYGNWTSFVQRTFPLSVKTANIWIRAWEGHGTELAVNDWDAYMRALYGHEPKKLKASSKKSRSQQEDDEDDEAETQHGGPGLHPAVFRDKHGVLSFKNLIMGLQAELLNSLEFTRDEKLAFIKDLINWLLAQKKTLEETKPKPEPPPTAMTT
jgi:hypothetical protein